MIVNLKRKIIILALTFCFILSMCCMFSCLVNAEGNELEIKDIKMTITPYGNGNMYDLTVNTVVPFTVAGEQNLEQKEELVRENLIINGKTIAEIDAFNERYGGGVVQIHRFEMIKIYIFDDFGSLPCGEHETNSACDCEDKRPVLKNDNTDIIEFKAGFTTGGFGAISTDSLWALKQGAWWKDGIVLEGNWMPLEEGATNVEKTYDISKTPELPFFAQKMTGGNAKYAETVNAEEGINIRVSVKDAQSFTVKLLNDKNEGVSAKFFTDEKGDNTFFKVDYLFDDKDSQGNPMNISWEESYGGRWVWDSLLQEWAIHSVQLKRVDGYMRLYINGIELPMLYELSYFHYMDLTELTVTVESDAIKPGNIWLGQIENGEINKKLTVLNISDIDFNTPNFQAILGIQFSDILGAGKLNVESDDYFIQNYIKINGYTIKELNSAVPNSVIIHRNGTTLKDLNFYVTSAARVPIINNDGSISASQKILINQDSKISISFEKGFSTNNGLKIFEENNFYYNSEYLTWFPVEELFQTDVNTVQYNLRLDDFYAIQVGFSDVPSDVDKPDVGQTKSILDGIKIDGQSLRNIVDVYGKDVFSAHWTGGRLHLFIGIKDDQGNVVQPKTIELTTSLVTPNGHQIANNQKFEYVSKALNDERDCWYERAIEQEVVFEEINIKEITAPVYDILTGSFSINVYFDKPIADRSQVFLQGDPWWQVAAGLRSYDSVRLNNLTGVGESVREKLYFGRYVETENVDGTKELVYKEMSVMDMLISETNLGFQQTAVSIHMGNSGVNHMLFIISGTYDNKPLAEDFSNKSVNMITDINQKFTFRVEKGFKSLLGGEIKEECKYSYDPQLKIWIKDGDNVSEDSAELLKANYNGNEIKAGCVIQVGNAEKFDLNLLFVLLKDPRAMFEVVGPETLSEGTNEFLIKIKSSSGTKENEIKFYLEKDNGQLNSKKSCASILNKTNVVIATVVLASAVTIFMLKRRKVR